MARIVQGKYGRCKTCDTSFSYEAQDVSNYQYTSSMDVGDYCEVVTCPRCKQSVKVAERSLWGDRMETMR